MLYLNKLISIKMKRGQGKYFTNNPKDTYRFGFLKRLVGLTLC